MFDRNYGNRLFDSWRPRFSSACGVSQYRVDHRLRSLVESRWDNTVRPFYPEGGVATVAPSPEVSVINKCTGETPRTFDTSDLQQEVELVWVRPPEDSRVETRKDQGRSTLLVVNETAQGEWMSGGAARVNSRPSDARSRAIELTLRPVHGEAALALLRPWWFVRGYELIDGRESQYCERRIIQFTGVPSYDAQSVYDSGGEEGPTVFLGADWVEFKFDQEYGVLLRKAAYFENSEYEATSFESIEFDIPLQDELFAPYLLSGARSTSSSGHVDT